MVRVRDVEVARQDLDAALGNLDIMAEKSPALGLSMVYQAARNQVRAALKRLGGPLDPGATDGPPTAPAASPSTPPGPQPSAGAEMPVCGWNEKARRCYRHGCEGVGPCFGWKAP